MRRDLVKTIGGIIIIGAIVVTTFLYGNRQRQNQIKADRQAREQQEKRAEDAKQKQATAHQPSQPAPAAPAAQPQPVAAAPTQTPETGAEILYVIPGVAIVMLYRAKRSTAADVRTALLA